VFADYELRLHHAWNGVTGTAAGVAAHHRNAERAQAAAIACELLTVLVGAALVIPRRTERTWFKWSGWLALLIGGALAGVAATGLFGMALHQGFVAFDPRCALDGPCHTPPRPMSLQDWRIQHLAGISLAAIAITSTLMLCVGVRWGLGRLLALCSSRAQAD
jgi:hypothetical protein